MARPQEFDTQEVLQKVMSIFWKKGYSNTSIADLEVASGISRISLYNSFGSKEGIFLAALKIYYEGTNIFLSEVFYDRELKNIIDLFEKFTTPALSYPACTLGCLMINTIHDRDVVSEEIMSKIIEYRGNLRVYLVTLLEKNQTQFKDSSDIPEKADYIISLLLGVFITNRLYKNTEVSRQVVPQLKKTIASWLS